MNRARAASEFLEPSCPIESFPCFGREAKTEPSSCARGTSFKRQGFPQDAPLRDLYFFSLGGINGSAWLFGPLP